MSLPSRLIDFAGALRGHGITAGPSEVIDAAAVIEALGLDERDQLREGLAAALMRRAGDRQVFDDLFDVYFPRALGAGIGNDSLAASPHDARAAAAAIREDLAQALASADHRALEQLAARAVAELGRLPNDATNGAYSARQTLEVLSPQLAIARADAIAAGSGRGVGFSGQLLRDELRDGVAGFRRRVESESRRRNAEVRGTERIARYAVPQAADQTPFILAGATEIAELRRTVTPLARKLATRLAARRRRATRGEIDVRTTIRRSLATGGVPVHPAYKHRSPGRPDLVVLADFSSSVSGFTRFTILLLQALAGQFRRLRIFGFVNRCEEITDKIVGAAPGADLSSAFTDTSGMSAGHATSDYGATFADFAEHHLDAVTHRSTVLILGDARSNHTDPRDQALHAVVERARRVIWLNPEPSRSWATGDSLAHHYGDYVDMVECRNIAQLRTFVTRTLPTS